MGKELLHSGNWKTPADFLADYVKRIMTPEWGKTELAKPFEQRHPVVQWYDRMCRLQAKQKPGPSRIIAVTPNGAMRAYLLFSFDLYTLRHHGALQESLVRRLRLKDQFQGARHELFTAATCIRAGYDIAYEEESDRSSKHVEFIATHKLTRQQIAVEAKSRHRDGILGRPGTRTTDEEVRVRVLGLVNEALKKSSSYPYVIFLDLNLPPCSPVRLTQTWFQKIADPILLDREKKGGSDPWNLLVFSNYPDHYVEDDGPAPTGYAVGIFGKDPQIVARNPEAITAIVDAALKFGNLPNHFDEME